MIRKITMQVLNVYDRKRRVVLGKSGLINADQPENEYQKLFLPKFNIISISNNTGFKF